MSAWRRKLIALFPEKRQAIEKEYDSLYAFYLDFLPLTHEAHENKDDEFLKKIYGFSEWCSLQHAEDLWNPAGVSFYEHLFNTKRKTWQNILSWLSDRVIEQHKCLWELMLERNLYEDLFDLLKQRAAGNANLSFSQSNVFTSGLIFTL